MKASLRITDIVTQIQNRLSEMRTKSPYTMNQTLSIQVYLIATVYSVVIRIAIRMSVITIF
jgi:hypothetical protein